MLAVRIRLKLFSVAGLFVASSLGLQASPLDETVNTLDLWVETERLISETQAEWEANRSSMTDLVSIYKQEIETLAEVIATAESDTSAAETRRAELIEQDKAVKAVEAKALAAIIKAEKSIKGLEPVLPPPLREELTPLFNTVPKDPDASKLSIGQRIQPIIAILTQVQKFNQVVTLVEDFREFEAGRTVQTETVFFGLGAAFYVDRANENAGMGVPGVDGWEWTSDASLIPSVRSFVDIYRGSKQARYVELPVDVN